MVIKHTSEPTENQCTQVLPDLPEGISPKVMKNEKLMVTQTSNPTENPNIMTLPDLPYGYSPVGIILATSVLVKILVPVMKKNNK
ncbi:hypothetical protein [Okeania sp. SIO2B3]|uniref:hypothetical protein n=1 Tax=Okeania sp. SIO2B3 TaxID=2607784 RepID=UPI0013C03F0A|nr:hypothetical protein [Okeania sp. SIO2B3]NET43233.1 hypothetical protein [Okeania sp. SIO2B3]